ncbi:WD40 repeat-like protein [Rhizoctonia solani]|uniref:WD40 repeat-like protein n=1 Tax=Rhizoctonia solani TaxID=456999 RepID=A0A8H7I6K4_9AGAM|nr:WD40 repeat-like protein [Rhizoctonia solani]
MRLKYPAPPQAKYLTQGLPLRFLVIYRPPPPPIEDSPMQTLSSLLTMRLHLPRGLDKALKVFRQGVGLFPPLQATIDDVISCFDTLEIDPGYKTEYEELLLELEALSQTLANHVRKSNPAHMSDFITRMRRSIAKQIKVIEKKRDQPIERNIAKAEQDQREVLRAYHGSRGRSANYKVWSSVEEQTANNRLKELSPSKSAVYNSTLATEVNRRSCTEHTRTQILLELDEWSADSQTPNIYWMSGMAGTGKTTIAYTFAETLRKCGLLGASFFCTRTSSECQDVGRIIPTITYQLARYSMSFQTAVVEVLGRDPDIGTQAITEQCERLIKEPLDRVKDDIPDGLVVVIDALDECNSTNGVGMMLDVLFRVAADLPVKFFVTSRPEPDIRHRIESQSDRSRSICRLHDIEESLVQADVELYIRKNLQTALYPSLRSAILRGCPVACQYAATSIRYIRRKRTMADQDRLEAILAIFQIGSTTRRKNQRSKTRCVEYYGRQFALETGRRRHTRSTHRHKADKGRHAAAVSVLGAARVRTQEQDHHAAASFPDFVFDKTRSTRFYCNEAKHSQLLAERCFKRPDNKVNLAHAVVCCALLGDHVVKSTPCEAVRKGLKDFLIVSTAFLDGGAEPEAYVRQGHHHAVGAQAWLTAESGSLDLMQSVNDSRIFVSKYAPDRSRSRAPHIYISALAFCITQARYTNSTGSYSGAPSSARVCNRAKSNGATCNMAYALVCPLASISPDRSRFAVGFLNGTVRVLHGHSGAVALGPLEGRTREVNCVAFSPNGLLLASGSGHGTVTVRMRKRELYI